MYFTAQIYYGATNEQGTRSRKQVLKLVMCYIPLERKCNVLRILSMHQRVSIPLEKVIFQKLNQNDIYLALKKTKELIQLQRAHSIHLIELDTPVVDEMDNIDRE